MNSQCELQAGYNDWPLQMKNQCHLAVLNSEMGQLRDVQMVMNAKFDYTLGILVVIGIAVVGIVVKNLFKKT